MALTRAGLLRVGTASTTGAIQVGAGLSITSDGVLSGSGGASQADPIPSNTSSNPTFSSGSGTQVDPFIINSVTLPVGINSFISPQTITFSGLAAGQTVSFSDLNSASNSNRFAQPSGIVAGNGTYTFNLQFTDLGNSSPGTYTGLIKVGTSSVYFRWTITLQVPVNPNPGQVNITPGTSGSGTIADPYRLSSISINFGQLGTSLEAVVLSGLNPNTIVVFEDVSTPLGVNGSRFSQPYYFTNATGSLNQTLRFTDTPSTQAGGNYQSVLKCGQTYFAWDVNVIGQSINPTPPTVSVGAGSPPFEGGSGTISDPFILTSSISNQVGGSITSPQSIQITGQPANTPVIWINNSVGTGNRFAQPNGVTNNSGIWVGNLVYNDIPNSSAESTYIGNLQIGSVYFRWTVTQKVTVSPIFTTSLSASTPATGYAPGSQFTTNINYSRQGVPTPTSTLKMHVTSPTVADVQLQAPMHTITSPIVSNVVSLGSTAYTLTFANNSNLEQFTSGSVVRQGARTATITSVSVATSSINIDFASSAFVTGSSLINDITQNQGSTSQLINSGAIIQTVDVAEQSATGIATISTNGSTDTITFTGGSQVSSRFTIGQNVIGDTSQTKGRLVGLSLDEMIVNVTDSTQLLLQNTQISLGIVTSVTSNQTPFYGATTSPAGKNVANAFDGFLDTFIQSDTTLTTITLPSGGIAFTRLRIYAGQNNPAFTVRINGIRILNIPPSSTPNWVDCVAQGIAPGVLSAVELEGPGGVFLYAVEVDDEILIQNDYEQVLEFDSNQYFDQFSIGSFVGQQLNWEEETGKVYRAVGVGTTSLYPTGIGQLSKNTAPTNFNQFSNSPIAYTPLQINNYISSARNNYNLWVTDPTYNLYRYDNGGLTDIYRLQIQYNNFNIGDGLSIIWDNGTTTNVSTALTVSGSVLSSPQTFTSTVTTTGATKTQSFVSVASTSGIILIDSPRQAGGCTIYNINSANASLFLDEVYGYIKTIDYNNRRITLNRTLGNFKVNKPVTTLSQSNPVQYSQLRINGYERIPVIDLPQGIESFTPSSVVQTQITATNPGWNESYAIFGGYSASATLTGNPYSGNCQGSTSASVGGSGAGGSVGYTRYAITIPSKYQAYVNSVSFSTGGISGGAGGDTSRNAQAGFYTNAIGPTGYVGAGASSFSVGTGSASIPAGNSVISTRSILAQLIFNQQSTATQNNDGQSSSASTNGNWTAFAIDGVLLSTCDIRFNSATYSVADFPLNTYIYQEDAGLNVTARGIIASVSDTDNPGFVTVYCRVTFGTFSSSLDVKIQGPNASWGITKGLYIPFSTSLQTNAIAPAGDWTIDVFHRGSSGNGVTGPIPGVISNENQWLFTRLRSGAGSTFPGANFRIGNNWVGNLGPMRYINGVDLGAPPSDPSTLLVNGTFPLLRFTEFETGEIVRSLTGIPQSWGLTSAANFTSDSLSLSSAINLGLQYTIDIFFNYQGGTADLSLLGPSVTVSASSIKIGTTTIFSGEFFNTWYHLRITNTDAYLNGIASTATIPTISSVNGISTASAKFIGFIAAARVANNVNIGEPPANIGDIFTPSGSGNYAITDSGNPEIFTEYWFDLSNNPIVNLLTSEPNFNTFPLNGTVSMGSSVSIDNQGVQYNPSTLLVGGSPLQSEVQVADTITPGAYPTQTQLSNVITPG